MKLTNKLNLPQPLVDAVKNDSYTKGEKADVSVTQLIGPMQQIFLKRKHWDELEEDVSDLIWALLGQTMHTILERADISAIKEKRLYLNVDGACFGFELPPLPLLPSSSSSLGACCTIAL